MAVTTRKAKAVTGVSPSREVMKLTSRLIRRSIAKRLPAPREALQTFAERSAQTLAGRSAANGGTPLVQRLRSLPVQASIDIATPLELAYEEWMKLEFLPEGVHRIEDIERDGDEIAGRIAGALAHQSDWEAEISEERPNESFAWRSVRGSDCVGWVTFHRLSERLTRLELELDVIPVRPQEGFELLLHIADRRAETDLRRFKARLERISPDEYASVAVDDGDETDNEKED
jgi:uncharacterized membrane protein